MKNSIKITAHACGFWVCAPENDDGSATILAEFPRYADALAAAHLIAREMGISVEAQPDGMEGGA